MFLNLILLRPSNPLIQEKENSPLFLYKKFLGLLYFCLLAQWFWHGAELFSTSGFHPQFTGSKLLYWYDYPFRPLPLWALYPILLSLGLCLYGFLAQKKEKLCLFFLSLGLVYFSEVDQASYRLLYPHLFWVSLILLVFPLPTSVHSKGPWLPNRLLQAHFIITAIFTLFPKMTASLWAQGASLEYSLLGEWSTSIASWLTHYLERDDLRDLTALGLILQVGAPLLCLAPTTRKVGLVLLSLFYFLFFLLYGQALETLFFLGSFWILFEEKLLLKLKPILSRLNLPFLH